jgi:flavin-dependent dehydrogenase
MEVNTTFDLIVVGGGPAGCAAAITAARAGASVLLFERGRFPRHKVCGEFVSAESLDLLAELLRKCDLKLIAGAPRIGSGRIFIDGAVLSAEINPPAASISRLDLDNVLWHSCAQAGVSARDVTVVESFEGGGLRPFTVRTSAGRFTGRAFINAAGRWSNLTSAAVRDQITSERRIGIKAHFKEHEAQAASSVDLYFFSGGYCGVQPLSFIQPGGSHINVCAMVSASVATSLGEVLACHPALRERSRAWESTMQPVSTSPLVFHEIEPVCNRMLQVGDAATFVDPFIGDGISLALRSGRLAADCLKPFFAGIHSLEQSLQAYQRSYAQSLEPVFRNSSRLRNLLRWPPAVRKPVLAILERTPALTRQLVRMTR